MNYAMQKNLYFKDYVVHYHERVVPARPGVKNRDRSHGLFTATTGARKSYDRSSWKYPARRRGTRSVPQLRDPHTVFQHLRRHYSRYTPAMVERVCGIPKAKFEEVAQLYCGTSGPQDGHHHLRAEPDAAHQRV